jgi:hypothetical protein
MLPGCERQTVSANPGKHEDNERLIINAGLITADDRGFGLRRRLFSRLQST